MSTERDPRRLLDGNDALEEGLRRALRAASEDGPSSAQLEALIDGTVNVLSTGATGAAAAGHGAKWALLKSGWVKLGLALCALGGSTYWALQPSSEQGPVATRTASNTHTPPPPGGPNAGRSEDGSRPQATPHRAAPTTPIVEPLTPPARTGAPDESEPAGARRAVPDEASRRAHPSKERPSSPARAPAATRAAAPVAPSRETAVSTPARRATPQRPPARASADAIEPTGHEAPDELQLLSRAQHVLSSQPRMALALLGQHRQQHPQSNLAQERDAMELEALARIGPADRLRERARAFLRRYPRSPHGERVRAILAQSE